MPPKKHIFVQKQRVMKKIIKKAAPAPRRDKRLTCLVNEKENEIIDNYLQRYNIRNKSTWMRETILWFIYTRAETDYPTLFSDHEMRR